MKEDGLSIPYTGDVQPAAVACNVAEEQLGYTVWPWGAFWQGSTQGGQGCMYVCLRRGGEGRRGLGDRGELLLLLLLIPNSVRSDEGTEETKPAHDPRDGALWQSPSWSTGRPWD